MPDRSSVYRSIDLSRSPHGLVARCWRLINTFDRLKIICALSKYSTALIGAFWSCDTTNGSHTLAPLANLLVASFADDLADLIRRSLSSKRKICVIQDNWFTWSATFISRFLWVRVVGVVGVVGVRSETDAQCEYHWYVYPKFGIRSVVLDFVFVAISPLIGSIQIVWRPTMPKEEQVLLRILFDISHFLTLSLNILNFLLF